MTKRTPVPLDSATLIRVRRHWDDWKIGSIPVSGLHDLHWDQVSGGVGKKSPRPMMYGYAMCTEIEGGVAHSGVHGPCPHRIKVVVVKKDNDKRVVDALVAQCDQRKAAKQQGVSRL